MMINTRKDLKFYLQEDRKRNNVPQKYWKATLKYLAGYDNVRAYYYIWCMRHCEYHLNNSSSCYHKILYILYRFKMMRLGFRYGISINLNSCGYGLRIIHLSGGGGILLNIKKAGNYCGFNAGVLLGNKDNQENRPILGHHVAFGPGAKAFGKITIGNNVFIAPNAVVTKNVPDNCIVGGVPARIIKKK